MRLVAFTAGMLWAGAALAEPEKELVRLTYLSDGDVLQSITVLGNSIDPNTRSDTDAFALAVNGAPRTAKGDVIAGLALDRRTFSYDVLSGGIESVTPQLRCNLGGPARGWVLEVRYLTYSDGAITGDQMRPVFSRPDNCLFQPLIRPKDDQAALEAAEMLGRLRTLLETMR